MKPIPLREYAESRGILYMTAWRRFKKGNLSVRKDRKGNIFVTGEKGGVPGSGPPRKWTREKIAKAVYELCKDRYVAGSRFPSFLYKLCVKYFGSVRRAKLEARILNSDRWTKKKFIAAVREFCEGKYRDEKKWPPHLKQLAKKFSGSPRAAKWEAGIINDPRSKARQERQRRPERASKEQFLVWVKEFCGDGYKKAERWPGFMRELAVRHCGSVRAAKWEAEILKNRRDKLRK